jgi:hypothetical protein
VLGTPGLDIVLFIGKEGGSKEPPFFVRKKMGEYLHKWKNLSNIGH